MERLFYDKKILEFINKMPDMADKIGVDLDTRYLYYHNDICPKCLNQFKLSHDRTVRGVGAFATSVLTNELKKLIPYVVCKQCAKRVNNKEQMTLTEDYLIETLKLEE